MNNFLTKKPIDISQKSTTLSFRALCYLVLILSACFVSQPSHGIQQDSKEILSDTNVSFESADAGKFRELSTKIGTWQNVAGTVLIDNKHFKSGRQCLHLAGGERSSVELLIDEKANSGGRLTFWAERWTSRAPFSFRIEKLSAVSKDKWIEIYNGDQSIRVGRAFLNQVSIPLGKEKIQRLRFSVTSPAKTGILIDDIRFVESRPQKIESVTVVPLATPVLIGKKHSPVVKLKILTTGTLDPISVQNISATLAGTTAFSEIESWGITKSDANFQAQTPVDANTIISYDNQPTRISFSPTELKLEDGVNHLWLTCQLKSDANIDYFVGADIESVTLSNGQSFEIDAPPSIQRMGFALRQSGDDKVHTYRIPGLATTNKGTLIGVYDVRYDGGKDLPGNIDVGMSRSTDGGKSWKSMKVIMDMGSDPKWNGDGIGDPAVLVDRETGTIWVSATWSHGNRSWNGSGPGLSPEETGQWMLAKSDDDGVTWSKPINITNQVKNPEWSFLLQGPGKGISMSDGTLVIPAQYQDPSNKDDKVANRLPHSTFIFSRDHGKTWTTGTGAWDDTTEAQIIELNDGELMLNCRFNRANNRVVTTTSDMGSTWKEHATTRKALIEPRACMASLINVGRELSWRKLTGFDNQFLLFSNPESLTGRNHITIKASKDGGNSWPKRHRLLLDELGGRGYSCLSMIDSETVGILYEGSQSDLTFQRVKLADILSPPKDQKTRNPALSISNSIRYKKQLAKPAPVSVAFARPFGDHMVLQANRPLNIWGTAQPGSVVKIEFGLSDPKAKSNSHSAPVDSKGNWSVQLLKHDASKIPHTLSATAGDANATINDILIGEVWFCAGQSNMEWPLLRSESAREAIGSSNDPLLRLHNCSAGALGGARAYSKEQIDRLSPSKFNPGQWKVASPKSTPGFSAVAYYFAKRLRNELDVPVGMINVSAGGTPIESWVSTARLKTHPDLSPLLNGNWLDNEMLDQWCRGRAKSNLKRAISGEIEIAGDEYGPNHSFKPGFMFDSAIKPFSRFSIAGGLWYQGESNADNAGRVKVYDLCFPLLVNEWRTEFPNKQLPIAFVQLPAMGRPIWPVFREYQRRSLSRISNIGMAITIDTGHPTNVHPIEKKLVGQRLAQWALVNTYKIPGLSMGPLYKAHSFVGDSMVISFDHVGDGLTTSDGTAPNQFEIAAQNGGYFFAQASIEKSTIRLRSPNVTTPKRARYAWSAYPTPKPNLVNSAGLPASPFSTEVTVPAETETR